jgi:uncharacterized protein (UPF0297 family)
MNYLESLKAKINGYKSYNQAVKDRVLKQLENKTHLSENEYMQVCKKLGVVMKANKRFLVEYNKIKNKVVKLERNIYAPELNCIHFKDGTIKKTPQKTTINEAIEYIVYKKAA